MFKHGFFAVAMTFVLITSLLSSAIFVPASASSASQMQNEISELEKKSAKLEKEIEALKKDKAEQNALKLKLDQQIAVTQEKISACTNLINGYKGEITDLENKIAAKEAEIEDTKFLFRQRMRSIYMSGSTNNDLLVLLDAESFSDYLSLSEVSRTISTHDKKIVNEITEAIKEINASKIAINEKMAKQNNVKKTLANEQAKLKVQQSEVNKVIASINSNQTALEEENDGYEADIERLDQQVKAALAAAAAEAEAKAKAESEAKAKAESEAKAKAESEAKAKASSEAAMLSSDSSSSSDAAGSSSDNTTSSSSNSSTNSSSASSDTVNKNPDFTSGKFTWPVPGYYNITSYYGYRVNPVSGIYKLHGGIDVASAGIYGKPIVAAADGVVLIAGWSSSFGNWVLINHGMSGGKQYATVYAHMCKSPSVSSGQSVTAGQTIGYVGSTGNSTGNHLHFEIRVNGDRVDPMNYYSKAS